ncbi:MAG: glycine--tRNA ligase subunit beta [Acidobacteriota bacterium]|nr:glycine--tRNA ligase subunit beta [Acidobacteriota bacterium]MDQ3419991.1 glycine--tRNA ligase subunit beta [Acidobacteriota bacterium]
MDRELLIEIGVEELPAAWLPNLTRQMAEKLEARLKDLRLAPLAPIESFATPRRLTVAVGKIAERQEDLEETITGPPVSAAYKDGAPTPAGLGFARKQGVEFEQITRVKTSKGEYLAFHKRQRGKSAVDALPDLMTALLRDLSFPKQMNWDARLDDGKGNFTFGRPIRWLLFLYGGRVVPYTIPRVDSASGPLVQDIESGALTYGHRFLATSGRAGRSIKVRSVEEYRAKLAEHFVVLQHSERRDRIGRELESHARRLSARVRLKEHAALLSEVADLVEFPGVVAGFFDRSFLDLPQEVLTTTLVHHQHWFPVVTPEGHLKEAFLAVVNTQPQDERIIAKNAERVVTARLRDAKFFFDADRKAKLESRLERLHTVQFHKKVGSYRDKTERIVRLAQWIAADRFASPAEAVNAARAATLSKTDLTTDMVFEFPELQGTMGGVYAREEGEPEQVWKAIYYQYLPIGVEADAPPARAQLGAAAITWAALSLADKLDTFVALTSAGEKATGSRDPFALRRQVQGAVRILMDLPELTGIDREISLNALLGEAASGVPGTAWPAEAARAAEAFALERVRYALEQRRIPGEVARAATSSGDLRPLRARRMAEALQATRASEDFQALAVLFKRVKNISKDVARGAEIDRTALVEPAERALLAELGARRPRVEQAAASHDYKKAFTEIAGLRAAVDTFFTDVFVMADDERLRTARLSLMAGLRDLILDLADISEIVPQTE